MSINASTIRNLAPELTSQTDDRINYFITEAARYVNASIWGAKTDFAHALYTAHLMTMAGSGGAGNVSSERVGDLSRTYSVDTSSGSMSGTSYGQQFLSARKSLLISPMVIR